MELEFLHTSCEDGELVVRDENGARELGDVLWRGRVDGREVFCAPEHLDGVTPCLLRDDAGTYLAAVDVNGLSFWTRDDDGVPFLFVEHPHDPVSVRGADGHLRWYDLETGEVTQRRAWVRDGCCCS